MSTRGATTKKLKAAEDAKVKSAQASPVNQGATELPKGALCSVNPAELKVGDVVSVSPKTAPSGAVETT